MRNWISAALFGAAVNLTSAPVIADEAEFCKNKQVSLIIATGVGGGYDLYARLVARHLGKYIPGNPDIIPQNMNGGGGNIASGYIYSTAPKDGSVIGAARAGVVGIS